VYLDIPLSCFFRSWILYKPLLSCFSGSWIFPSLPTFDYQGIRPYIKAIRWFRFIKNSFSFIGNLSTILGKACYLGVLYSMNIGKQTVGINGKKNPIL